MMPFTISGSERPRKSGRRLAGLAISGESVCVQRSPPIVMAIPYTPAMAVSWTAFPVTKNVSSCSSAKRPT